MQFEIIEAKAKPIKKPNNAPSDLSILDITGIFILETILIMIDINKKEITKIKAYEKNEDIMKML